MPSTENIERDYRMEDIDMLERAQVFHDNFVLDEALFQAAFTKFGLTYAADFQTLIDDADAIPSGSEVDSQIEILTEQLENKMVTARAAMQKLFTYSDITFNSSATTKSFGKDDYERSRDSHKRMKELLEKANRLASVAATQAAFIAEGYTAADITELKTISDDLDALNEQQEDLKSLRLIKTEDRVKAYNAVWAVMSEINQASKVVFVDSPAKLTMYLLYPTEHSSLSKPQNLTAVVDAVDPTKVNIDFDTVLDATEYRLYGSIVDVGDPSGTYTELTSGATNHFDTPLTVGKRNYWKVRAFNATQSSSYSSEVWLDA